MKVEKITNHDGQKIKTTRVQGAAVVGGGGVSQSSLCFASCGQTRKLIQTVPRTTGSSK
jgi:hypothetical protein